MIEPLIVEISKLNLSENDYLVIKFPDDFPYESVVRAFEDFKKQTPKLLNSLIMIHGDVQLSVIHEEK